MKRYLFSFVVAILFASAYGQYGCTDPSADNYDPYATIDDGSCVYSLKVYGCTDINAINYNPYATDDDGSCQYGYDTINGCTDTMAINWDPLANYDDGSCIYRVYGCMDPNALNYNPSATNDDGSCIYPIYGCMDPNALNYNPSATADDGSCLYSYDTINGCTDTMASNYNPLANYDDGSCIYSEDIYGCMNPYASNYNPDATINQGCIYELVSDTINGCTDTMAINYDPLATYDDSSCIYSAYEVPGCTDPQALNYNPDAAVFNGRCIYAFPDQYYKSGPDLIPVDTLGNRALVECFPFFYETIDSAVITDYRIIGRNLATKWIISSEDNSQTILQNYELNKTGINLIYLSVICDSSKLKSTQNVMMAKTFAHILDLSQATSVSTASCTIQEMILYPNPTRESITVVLPNNIDIYQINVIGMDGKIIYSTNYIQQTLIIPVKNLPSGMYIIQAVGKNKILVSKKFQKL